MHILAITAALALATCPALAQDSYASLPGVETLPEGVIQISGVVPAMGEHWADPATLPLGPIYCVHEGFEVPHYDIHMYLLSPEEVALIRPE